ncbi:helix-turn-helix transcriptional regulator [Thiomicrospira microaerophila]|uniref:helix-turn-helix transcriptional regulator n=1 Tax=Thiomicrospira microaerophila TaxID=406020 RepID=UPI000698FD13|nr:helix-turn-helix transcriptional regulator [Thiomicrospira microaerophila]
MPYDKFIAKFSEPVEQGLIPHDIVVRHTEHDVPLVKCWREHLGMTQAELALASGVQQPEIARIESSIDYTPRKTTLEKLAKAMRISLDQLLVE